MEYEYMVGIFDGNVFDGDPYSSVIWIGVPAGELENTINIIKSRWAVTHKEHEILDFIIRFAGGASSAEPDS